MTGDALAGRRVLLIGIGFYDYEQSIAARLRERGADLTVFEDLPRVVRTGLVAGLLRRVRWGTKQLVARHEQRMLAAARQSRFDQVLVIKGIDLSVSFLRTLRQALPRAEFVLYQWDSLRRLNGIEDRLPFFDRVLTFDRNDALARPELAFRPLFFRQIAQAAASPDIDLAFIGWLHSNRLDAVRRLQADAAAQGLTSYVYLFTGLLTWLKLALRGKARDVHVRTLPYDKVMRIHARARCVYDLPHAHQSGLTMRTIEAVGMRKKLLTTALDIVEYDFYSPQNVRLVHESTSGVDREFVLSEATPVPTSVLRRYSLDAWLDDVLLDAARTGRLQA
jgi:hypothetical protein